MPRHLTTKGVAGLLKVAPETVRLYARQGRIPFEQTPGGHRRFDEGAVLAAIRAERDAQLSVGPNTLTQIARTETSVNFDVPPPSASMAPEVAALASQARREPLTAPVAANEVHAALMRWAEPARVPARR